MAQVLCFGEALVDRLGPPGGDPAQTEDFEDRLGGAPANVACALGRLGTATGLVSRLGRDAPGRDFAALLKQRGVATEALQWDDLRPTRVVLVQRDAAGERQFGGFMGDRGAGFADQAIAAGALEAPVRSLLVGAQWLVLGSLPMASPASAEALARVVDLAHGAAVPLALDVNWRPSFWNLTADGAKGRLQPLISQARLLKLSGEEADWLFERRDPEAIASSLPQRPAVVVSDGAAPLRWWWGEMGGSLPAWAVPVVDSTGAGDAFLAGLLHQLCGEPGLLEAADPEGVRRAMAFAAACGALVCQGAGAIDPQPDGAAVRAFLKERQPLRSP